ncbi:MAG: phytoene desaturase family protein [Acidimicrobiia bacterium]
MVSAAIVGGGVGGLAAAIRLRALGHDVVVLERNDTLGGKLAVREHDGFTFDVGPSVLTLPHVIDECFGTVGAALADEVTLHRLDPQLRYHWPDGTMLDVREDPAATAAAFDAFSSRAGAQWRRFDERGRRIWDVSERTFFAGPMSGPTALVRRLRSPRDLAAIDPLATLARRARQSFTDERLVQWASRYATYSGSSPFRAPATLGCIPHIESRFGVWYPQGGLGALRDAFVRVATGAGAELRTGVEVVAISSSDDRVVGVELAGGERIRADIVVADVDAHHLYADLLPDRPALRRVDRAERSTSGFVVVAGADGATPGVAHHQVWFSGDYEAEFARFEAGDPSEDPTVYACVSSVTDPTQAPTGAENWFLLVNVPPRPDRVTPEYVDVVLDTLERRGVELRSRARFVDVITPGDFERRDRSPGGAIYGTSSNGWRSAFLRPGNRGARRGLYLVGGSSHPGGGLPLVTMSARIVADMIKDDGW